MKKRNLENSLDVLSTLKYQAKRTILIIKNINNIDRKHNEKILWMKSFKRFIQERLDKSYQHYYNLAVNILKDEIEEEGFDGLYPFEDIDENEMDKKYFMFFNEEEMNERIDDVIEDLESLPDKIKIYRAVNVTDGLKKRVMKWNKDWESWTVDEDVAVNLFSHKTKKDWLLIGYVNSKDVDWELTLNRRIIHNHEKEIAVKNPFKINIIKIKNIGTSKEYEDIKVDKNSNSIIYENKNQNIFFHGSNYNFSKFKSPLASGNIRSGEEDREGFRDVIFLTKSIDEAKQYGKYIYVVKCNNPISYGLEYKKRLKSGKIKSKKKKANLLKKIKKADKMKNIYVAYPTNCEIINKFNK